MKTRNIIIAIIGIICIHTYSYSQTNDFEYIYDANGNRKVRQLITSSGGRIAASPLEEEKVLDSEALNEAVLVFPNPGTGIYQVVIPEVGEEAIQLTVYDISGRLLYTNQKPQALTPVNLQDQPKGIYLFKVKTNNGSTIKKILKE